MGIKVKVKMECEAKFDLRDVQDECLGIKEEWFEMTFDEEECVWQLESINSWNWTNENEHRDGLFCTPCSNRIETDACREEQE